MINDPNLLLSIINTKLRDFYKNLDDLCEDLDFDKDEIIEILKTINYYYDLKENKFISKEAN